MFAVFHKDQFVNFWLNQPSDKTWIHRTIKAMGWIPGDVDVMAYSLPISHQTIYSFDEQKQLLIHEKDQDGILQVKETWPGEPYMVKGNLVNES